MNWGITLGAVVALAAIVYLLIRLIHRSRRHKRIDNTKGTVAHEAPECLDNGGRSEMREAGTDHSGARISPNMAVRSKGRRSDTGPGPGLNYSRRTSSGTADDPDKPADRQSGRRDAHSLVEDNEHGQYVSSRRGLSAPAQLGHFGDIGRSGGVRTGHRTPEIPGGRADPVHFSVTSPPSMTLRSVHVIDVWAHLGDQRDLVLARAREEAGSMEVRIKSEGPVRVASGTTLTVRLRIPGLKVTPARKPILWEGDIGNASFMATVPVNATLGSHAGTATILINNVPMAKLYFTIEIGMDLGFAGVVEGRTCAPQLQGREQLYRKAFASYASEDRRDVLARIQGILKALPSLDVFLDVANLRSGEHWVARLKEEIVRRDVFYLFWSEAASRSKWVDWEWRCALRERGINFIDPCPLASPERVPPPKELADELHFNDWVLAYMPYETPT